MKREQNKQEKRAAILAAAHAEFEGRRFDEVTLDDIAVRASVGKGTLYLYFKNKEDLFLQLAVDGIAEMVDRVKEIVVMESSYEERFFLFGEEIGAFLYRRHSLIRLMQQKLAGNFEQRFDRQRKKIIRAVHEFLELGVSEGALRKDLPIDALQCALVGPFFLRKRMEEHGVRKVELDALLKLFWAGAAVRQKGEL